MGVKRSVLVTDVFNGTIVKAVDEDKAREFILKDDKGSSLASGRNLMVKFGGSHWGYVNGNGFFYDPETVDNTIPTWTLPFQKPVLPYHPNANENDVPVLGRIKATDYILGAARAFVEDERIPENKPHGHLEFLTRISDPDAIPQVIDGRLDTVSISALATNVACSICGDPPSIVKDSTCQHTRFRRYNKDGEKDTDGNLCFYKAGPLCGRHLAFVLSPSDKYAGVKGYEWGVADAQKILMELFVISDEDQLLLSLCDDSSVNMFDRLQEGDVRAAIFDMLRIGSEDTDQQDAIAGEHVENTGEEGGILNKLDVWDLLTMTEEEIDTKLKEEPDILTEDAKLTYKQRKALPDSAFCGPGRSFPAHDAAHVRNGLARLNQAKGKPKAKILSCLKSRAKKYGIKVTTKVKNEANGDTTIEEIGVVDVILADATIEDILGLDIVEAYLSKEYVRKDADGSAGTEDTPTADGTPTGDSGKTDAPPVDMERLQAIISDKDNEIKALNADRAHMYGKLKGLIVDQIVGLHLTLRKVDSEGVEALRGTLMERNEQSLTDTLTDLTAEASSGKPLVPQGKVESAQVSDGRDPDNVEDGSSGGYEPSGSEARLNSTIYKGVRR